MVNKYETNDFYLAVLARTLKYPLIDISRDKSKVATFIFEDINNDFPLQIKKYWNREIECDARTLVDSIHELKTRLYTTT